MKCFGGLGRAVFAMGILHVVAITSEMELPADFIGHYSLQYSAKSSNVDIYGAVLFSSMLTDHVRLLETTCTLDKE